MGNLYHTTGNVGIGTSTPLVPLDVRGGSVRVDASGSFEQSVVFASTASAWARGLYFCDSRAIGSLEGRTGGIGMYGEGSSPTYIFIGHGETPWTGTNSIYLLKNGNMGIGTNAPTVKLDVNGVAQAGAVSVTYSTPSTNTTTGALVVAGGVGMAGALNVGGNLTVGDFGGATNVMIKLNNTGTAVSSPAVGCAIPLCAIHQNASEKSNTTPLPPGTWFVYLFATENGTDADEDIVVVMAKIWTVGVGTYLRFAPTSVNPSSTSNIGISYSRENNTGVRQEGTFTTMTGATDAYFSDTAEYPLATVIPGAGDHRGILAFPSNSAVRMLNGFAVRIA